MTADNEPSFLGHNCWTISSNMRPLIWLIGLVESLGSYQQGACLEQMQSKEGGPLGQSAEWLLCS